MRFSALIHDRLLLTQYAIETLQTSPLLWQLFCKGPDKAFGQEYEEHPCGQPRFNRHYSRRASSPKLLISGHQNYQYVAAETIKICSRLYPQDCEGGEIMTYRRKVADSELRERLGANGAVLIEGPKACGKTETAPQIANVR